jgi:hypothetical protein
MPSSFNQLDCNRALTTSFTLPQINITNYQPVIIVFSDLFQHFPHSKHSFGTEILNVQRVPVAHAEKSVRNEGKRRDIH